MAYDGENVQQSSLETTVGNSVRESEKLGLQPIDRNGELRGERSEMKKVVRHPLEYTSNRRLDQSPRKYDRKQANGRVVVQSGDDPLSSSFAESPLRSELDGVSGNWESWRWKTFRDKVNAEFASRDSVTIDTKYLRIGNSDQTNIRSKSVALSKSKMRLEHLQAQRMSPSPSNDFQLVMTRKEYIDRIDRLGSSMVAKWESGERVQTLRTAIQCAKMLTDISNPTFYPSLWIEIVENLEKFGKLVYDRVLGIIPTQIRNHFMESTSDPWPAKEVPALAKETCRNWFFKIACIKDLVPRLYVEISLLRCYRFLTSSEHPSIVARLVGVIRGIGDPLIAAYCRAFLCYQESNLWHSGRLVSHEIEERKKHLFTCVFDHLYVMDDFARSGIKVWTTLALSEVDYIGIHGPALELMLRSLSRHATKQDLNLILSRCENYSVSDLVYCLVLTTFPPQHYAGESLALIRRTVAKNLPVVVRARIFIKMAEGLLVVPPPGPDKKAVFQEACVAVEGLESTRISVYVEFVSAFVRLALKHYSETEVFLLLNGLIKVLDGPHRQSLQEERCNPSRASSEHGITNHLEQICRALCERSNDFHALLTNDLLTRLLDMFKSDTKSNLCKSLIRTFVRGARMTSDPLVIRSVFSLARDLHDEIDSLTLDDERRQVGELVCQFIAHVDFRKDVEQQFSFLTDCRASFSNLGVVIEFVIHQVCNLVIKVRRQTGGRHTKRSHVFVKSCLAFCMITIPSVNSPLRRLSLFRHCGQLSLANNLLPQTDSFFKQAIMAILEVPESIPFDPSASKNNHRMIPSEQRLAENIICLVAAVLPAPGHPEKGPFTLAQGLFEAVELYPHWTTYSVFKVRCKLALLSVLAAYGQQEFFFRISGVESNDTLYGGQKDYVEELSTFAQSVLESVKEDLGSIEQRKEVILQQSEPKALILMTIIKESVSVSLQLINILVAFYQLNDRSQVKVVKRLINLVAQNTDMLRGQKETLMWVSRVEGDLSKLIWLLENLISTCTITISESRANQHQIYVELLSCARAKLVSKAHES